MEYITNRRSTPAKRKIIEKEILTEAKIICTTLSLSRCKIMEDIKPGDIEYLVIDEACQSTEPSSLIPLFYSPTRVIMVGDPMQLPSTTFQPDSLATNYSRSLFERLMERGVEKLVLTEQFRMNPQIREFPSRYFYENKLTDSGEIKQGRIPADEGLKKMLLSSPNRVAFYDLKHA